MYITIKKTNAYTGNPGQKAGISHINYIMNKSNGNLISHETLQKNKKNLKINYIEVLQLQSSIPKNWMIILKQNTHIVHQ